MATLTRSQIEFYAAAVGLPARLFGAIGEAESSGRTDVVNSIGAVGLFQINQPVHVRDHPGWTVAWLQQPGNNAAAAKVLYDQDKAAGGDGLGPWAASRAVWSKDPAASGASSSGGTGVVQAGWLAPDPFGDAGIAGGGVGGHQTVGTDAAASVKSVADLALGAGKWMANPHNWIRVAMTGAGGGMVIAGLIIATRGTWEPIAKSAINTAAKVAP